MKKPRKKREASGGAGSVGLLQEGGELPSLGGASDLLEGLLKVLTGATGGDSEPLSHLLEGGTLLAPEAEVEPKDLLLPLREKLLLIEEFLDEVVKLPVLHGLFRTQRQGAETGEERAPADFLDGERHLVGELHFADPHLLLEVLDVLLNEDAFELSEVLPSLLLFGHLPSF